MNEVTTLTLPQGIDIDILVKNGKIGYTFQLNGQNYGTAVKPKSRKVADVATACLLLIINAGETYAELTKDGKPNN
jgi:hypothetical protein